MNKFSFSRMMQYARYDMTLNRAFYRNLAIVTASCVMGIAILGFLIRWGVVTKSLNYDYPEWALAESAEVGGTASCLSLFGGLMMLVFAGCVNHPLRNKQGRISTLTLPATNSEKFLWHVLVMLCGGMLLFIVSVALADGVNALFSVLTGFPSDYIHSLTRATFGPYFGIVGREEINQSLYFMGPVSLSTRVLAALMAGGILSSAWSIIVFMYGNALKYRHNIIWTILSMIALQFVLSVVMIIVGVQVAAHLDSIAPSSVSQEQIKQIVWTCYWIVMGVLTLTGTSMGVACWRRYKNAQLVDRWNK